MFSSLASVTENMYWSSGNRINHKLSSNECFKKKSLVFIIFVFKISRPLALFYPFLLLLNKNHIISLIITLSFVNKLVKVIKKHKKA